MMNAVVSMLLLLLLMFLLLLLDMERLLGWRCIICLCFSWRWRLWMKIRFLSKNNFCWINCWTGDDGQRRRLNFWDRAVWILWWRGSGSLRQLRWNRVTFWSFWLGLWRKRSSWSDVKVWCDFVGRVWSIPTIIYYFNTTSEYYFLSKQFMGSMVIEIHSNWHYLRIFFCPNISRCPRILRHSKRLHSNSDIFCSEKGFDPEKTTVLQSVGHWWPFRMKKERFVVMTHITSWWWWDPLYKTHILHH